MKRLIRAVFWAGLLSLAESLISLCLGMLFFAIEFPDIPIFALDIDGGGSVLTRSMLNTYVFLLLRWMSLNPVAVAVFWYLYDVELNSVRAAFRVAYVNVFLIVSIFALWSLTYEFLRHSFILQKPFYVTKGIYGLALSAFVAPLLIWCCIQAFSWVTRKWRLSRC